MEICSRISKKIVKRMRKWKSSAPAGSQVDEDLDEEIAYQLQFQDLMNVHPNFVQASSSSTGNSQARFPDRSAMTNDTNLRQRGLPLRQRGLLLEQRGLLLEKRGLQLQQCGLQLQQRDLQLQQRGPQLQQHGLQLRQHGLWLWIRLLGLWFWQYSSWLWQYVALVKTFWIWSRHSSIWLWQHGLQLWQRGTKSVVVTESEENFLRAFGINLKPRILRKECGICFETRPHSSFITTNSCAHEYCTDCCKRHAEGKIESGSSTIECPHASCGHSYDIEQCTTLLSKSSLHTLNMRLVEQAIPAALRVYCPVPGCSAFMEKSESQGTFAECLACNRAFCQACHVPWHSNQTCSEFRANELNTKLSGDQKFRDLAKQEKWQNCPDCQRLVERTSGCRHITCVCKNEFYYSCGKKYKNKAASCKC